MSIIGAMQVGGYFDVPGALEVPTLMAAWAYAMCWRNAIPFASTRKEVSRAIVAYSLAVAVLGVVALVLEHASASLFSVAAGAVFISAIAACNGHLSRAKWIAALAYPIVALMAAVLLVVCGSIGIAEGKLWSEWRDPRPGQVHCQYPLCNDEVVILGGVIAGLSTLSAVPILRALHRSWTQAIRE